MLEIDFGRRGPGTNPMTNPVCRPAIGVTALVLAVSACCFAQAPVAAPDRVPVTAAAPAGEFRNPLLPSGPDPWVIAQDGVYYYTNSTGNNLTLWKTRDITDLAQAEKKVVWTPPASGPYSKELWAPELHRFDGKWYLYFAADDGRNESH